MFKIVVKVTEKFGKTFYFKENKIDKLMIYCIKVLLLRNLNLLIQVLMK